MGKAARLIGGLGRMAIFRRGYPFDIPFLGLGFERVRFGGKWAAEPIATDGKTRVLS